MFVLYYTVVKVLSRRFLEFKISSKGFGRLDRLNHNDYIIYLHMFIIFSADNQIMKKLYFILIVLFVTAIFPSFAQTQTDVYKQEGIASWYGREFEGRPTASGEIFDPSQLTAAHPTLPFGTVIVVTNLHNNKSVTVRVNDRGPFVPARIVDVSKAAAEKLDMVVTGTAPVRIESTGRVSVSNPGNPVVGAQTSQVDAASIIPSVQPSTAPVFVSQPVVAQREPPLVAQPAPPQFKLTPASINIAPDKNYRLQVGSFRVARNAVDAFDRLKSAGLNPAYEKYSDSEGDYFRVVLAGIRGIDVQITSEKISAAGFKEAIIRAEN